MDWIADYPLILLLAVSLVAFLESFALLGILIPGVVLLFSLAALANTAMISPYSLLLFGAIGGFLGDVSSFLIGHRLQGNVAKWRWFRSHESWLEQGAWFIQKWGWLSVIIGRFLGPLRPVIPLVAGTLGMPAKQFIPLSSLTVLAWAPVYLLPGYFTGELTELWTLQPLSTRSILVYLLTVLALSGGALTIYHHAHPERWHLKGWISKHQAERWPVLSLALTASSMFIVGVLLLFPRADLDTQFFEFSESWATSFAHVYWLAISNLATPWLTYICLACLVLWLLCWRRASIALLALIVFGMLFVAITLLTPVFDLPAKEIWNLSSLVFLLGLSASMSTSDIHGLKRWPMYLLTSQAMAIVTFSQIWTATLSLSATGIAAFLAICCNGLMRVLWQSLHLPLKTPLSASIALLISLAFLATAVLSTL